MNFARIVLLRTMYALRTARPEDLDALAELEAKCFPPEEKCTRERFAERLAAYGDCFLILEKEGRIIGLIDGPVTNHETIVDEMYEHASCHDPKGRVQAVFGLAVDPKEQHQGCGGQLLRAFIQKARQEGREKVILTCKPHLIDWYSSFGFVNMGVSGSVHGGAVWHDMTLAFPKRSDDNAPRDWA